MEYKNLKEKPGPSGESDLIIITPDELAKLGLFQDIRTIPESPETAKYTYVNNAKKRTKKSIEDLKDTKIILNKTKNKIDVKEKNSLTSKSQILNKPVLKGVKTDQVQHQKILNSEIIFGNKAPEKLEKRKIMNNINQQTVLNSNFLNKSLDAQVPPLNKHKSTIKLNRILPPNKASVLNPSHNQTKILNSEIKLKKKKFIIAQKKIDEPKPIILNSQTGCGLKCIEASRPAVQNMKSTDIITISDKDITIKRPSNEPEILNSKFTFANIIDGKIPSKNNLPLKNDKSLEEMLKRKLSRVLQNDNKLLSKPTIVIDGSEKNLDKSSESVSVVADTQKSTSSKEPSRQSSDAILEGLEINAKTDYPSVEVQDLEKLEGPSNQITSLDNIRKEVNIISNKSICLSNEDLKHLALKVKSSSQNDSLIKVFSSKQNEEVLMPVEINTGILILEETKVPVKKEMDADVRKSKIESKIKNVDADENSDVLIASSLVTAKHATIERNKKTYGAKNKTSTAVKVEEEQIKNAKTEMDNFNKNNMVTHTDDISTVLVPPKSKSVEKEKDFIKNQSNDETQRDYKEGKSNNQDIPKILHKLSDTNSLPSTSKMIYEPEQHNVQQPSNKTEYQLQNVFEMEECSSKMGENFRDIINNESISIKSARLHEEQDETEMKTEKNVKENLHTSTNIVHIKDKKRYVNKGLCKINTGVKIEQEGFCNDSTISKKHNKINSKNSTEKDNSSDDRVNKISQDSCKISAGMVLDQDDKNKSNQLTQFKGTQKHERKQKMTTPDCSTLTKECDVLKIDKSDSTNENNSLKLMQKIPKKRGRPKKAISMNSGEENQGILDESKGETDKISDGVQENEIKLISEESLHSSNVSQVETNKNNTDTLVKLPGKRGRPKKTINVNKTQINEPLPSLENNEEMVTSTPLPKKRGRKRKSSVIIEDYTEPLILDTSRTGRKRKKINYFEMENSMTDILDKEDLGKKRKKHQISEQDKNLDAKPLRIYCNIKKKKHPPPIISDINESDDDKKLKEEIEQYEAGVQQQQNYKCGETKKPVDNFLSSNTKEDVTTQIISEGNKPDVDKKQKDEIEQYEVVGQQKDQCVKTEESVDNVTLNRTKEGGTGTIQIIDEVNKPEKDIKPKEQHETVLCSDDGSPQIVSKINELEDENEVNQDEGNDTINNRKCKYRRTGGSVRMLNSIFSAAVRNNLRVDSGDGESALGTSNIITTTCDRRKKLALLSRIVVDDDNMVICMACNKKVNNEKWDEHNRNVHYNLAWREGDQELNLDDTSFVTKTLNPILKKQKKLKCNKCGKAHTTVSAYISHLEQCNGIVSSGGLVTCAVCKTEMEKSKWSFHKLKKHNNLAWRIGDHPLNLNDKNLVMSVLNALYKAKKPLRCEKCGTTKKSVIGFLSHQSQCGLKIEEAKVKCELCDRTVLPVSMPTHIKMVHETTNIKVIKKKSDYFSGDSNAMTSKRRAAKRAMLVIDSFSKEKIVQEYAKHFLQNVDFAEENFVTLLLQKELTENRMIKCKFKNCLFETDVVKILIDHLNLCENKPNRYYTCKKCLLVCDTESEMKEHIKTAYNIDIIDDDFKIDYDDDDDEDAEDEEEENELFQELKRKTANEKKKLEKDGNYKIKPRFLLSSSKKPGQLFQSAYDYTVEFCRTYFAHLLFDHLRCLKREWLLLDDELIDKYLPRSGESCEVARIKEDTFKDVLRKDYTFRKFEIFETEVDEGIATIFCGGPIYALAWMPTPYGSLDSKQILAVAPAIDFDKKYLVNEHYSEPSVIQFWDFGILKNEQTITAPKLLFCLTFDFGPVWHLEWCPSGCFDIAEDIQCGNKMSRMGLLAVAGSDSMVYIYSIPFLTEDQMGLIYEVKPLLKLCLIVKKDQSLNKDKFYATKISWSMGVDHRYIAVGYTDGMVGLFDLCTNSKLLKLKDDDNVDVLLPYKLFQAHTHYISALSLLYLNGGNRWLTTGSFDRDTCVWDLSNGTKINSAGSAKRYIVSDGVWLTNWLAYINTTDESSTNSCPVHACIKSYRDYMYERVYITSSNTTIKSISSSNWLNGIIQSNSAGEILAMFPHQLLYSLDSEKHLKSYRYFFGCTKLIDKKKSPEERFAEEIEKQEALKHISRTKFTSESSLRLLSAENNFYNKYEPITYNEASEKYGLVFCDKIMDNFSDFLTNDRRPKYEVEAEQSKANLYSMQAINKIAFNPNLQASLYYATGYQVGFVRLTYMKFLERKSKM